MAYQAPKWVNHSEPAIDADNLQALCNAVQALDETMPTRGAKPVALTVALPANGWDSAALTQSVTAQGVTAQNIVIAAAAGDSFTPYSTHGVRVKTQTANTLTFACEIVPTVDLTANVVILA